MTGSLRRRLVLSLCGSMVTAWLATAYFTYFDTRSLIDEVTDEHLQQSAEIVLGLVGQLPADALPADLLRERQPDQRLSYRILTPAAANGSSGDFNPPVAEWRAGYSDVIDGGEGWRVYGASNAAGTRVEVAVRQEVRTSFAARVAAHMLHPVWIAAPLLAALIWGLVRWGLGPLERLTAGVKQRSPADLSPLSPQFAPTEVLPLVAALNSLFERIALARERDRRFAADAAHELRTPLAAIRAHAQVASHAKDTAERDQAISDVLVGVERGTRIVEQLLALARVEHDAIEEEAQPVDMAELARETIALIAPQAVARNIDLGLEVEPGLDARVGGNADLLAAMLRNLVDNALRYLPEGAWVTVRLARDEGNLLLRVEDSGPGIPPELRARVVHRFVRAGGSGTSGSGLGLAIVAEIVESHHGSFVLAERADGPGLVADVSLPLWKMRGVSSPNSPNPHA